MAEAKDAQDAKTVLALGAHYDDCPFGIPGVLIKAARRGYRVVVLNLIGDYSNFAPARERSTELKRGCVEISAEFGAEMRFLEWKGHELRDTPEAVAQVAREVVEVQPDVAFLLWPHDRHPDHVVASRICESAVRHAGSIVDAPRFRPPRAYYYDNGPSHTIGFEPDAFVDVSEEWPGAREWLERFMRLAYGPFSESSAAGGPDGSSSPSGSGARSEPRDARERPRHHPAIELKETLGAYRGRSCGVRRAEALRSMGAYPIDIL